MRTKRIGQHPISGYQHHLVLSNLYTGNSAPGMGGFLDDLEKALSDASKELTGGLATGAKTAVGSAITAIGEGIVKSPDVQEAVKEQAEEKALEESARQLKAMGSTVVDNWPYFLGGAVVLGGGLVYAIRSFGR
jgi:hypothetical protein